jgi:phenylacetate-CoA ligase
MLFDIDKILMETQFGIPVVNEYGASELDLVAFENPKGDWVVNTETILVEIVDADGNLVPHGKDGRVVITSFYNKAHPFIRYDIGDIGSLSQQSTARKPLLEKLTGRTNDIVILPSGKKAAGLTFYYITKSIIENDGNVMEFIIEQITTDHFIIKYVSKIELTKYQKENIRNEIERYLEPGLFVDFEKVSKLLRSKAGKLKQFSSKV